MVSYIYWLQSSLLFLPSFVAAQCYSPDGNKVDDPAFQPCVAASGTISMCCATNRTSDADTCLPNGLCHNPCVSPDLCGGSTGGKYWRESCTDQSWKSEFCLKQLCTDPSQAEGSAKGNVVVSQCSTDNTWCCGEMPADMCCRIEGRISLASSLGLSSSSVSRATSISTGSQTSGTSTTSILSNPTATATPSKNGLKMGVGVGIGIGVAFVAVVITFYLCWRRNKRDNLLARINSAIKDMAISTKKDLRWLIRGYRINLS